jgi:hypothetical protein
MAAPTRSQADADLGKAMDRVMGWVRKSFSAYITKISNHAAYLTLFAATGIAILCGMIPVFRMVGWGFQDLRFAGMLLAILVGICFIATESMLKDRPSTFATMRVPSDDPRLPKRGKFKLGKRELPILPPCVLLGLLISMPTILYFVTSAFGGADTIRPIPLLGTLVHTDVLNMIPMFLGVAVAIGLYCHLYASPRLELRRESEEFMHDLPIALNTLGNKLQEGYPQEAALDETANLMKGSRMEGVLRKALANVLGRAMTLYEALFSKTVGAMRQVKNKLVRSIMGMYSKISTWSTEAGATFAIGTAEFLMALEDAKEDLRERFAGVFSGLRVVACVLVPVVCGLSVLGIKMLEKRVLQPTGTYGIVGSPAPAIQPISSFELNVLVLMLALVCLALFIVFVRFGSYMKSGGDDIELARDIVLTLPLCVIVFVLSLTFVKFVGV